MTDIFLRPVTGQDVYLYDPTTADAGGVEELPGTGSAGVPWREFSGRVGNVRPGTGELQVIGYAPIIHTPRAVAVEPATGALAVVGFAPSLEVSEALSLLERTTPAPLPSHHRPEPRQQPQAVEPDPVPFVARPLFVAPGLGELVMRGYAPTVFTPPAPWSPEQDEEDIEDVLFLVGALDWNS